MDNNFSGAIWTNHALDRLEERAFTHDMAGATFQHPDSTQNGKNPGTKEFTKRFGHETVTLIGKQNEKYEWVILSAWIDPPRAGTNDFKKHENWKHYKKAGFWGKLWITLKQQMGM